MIKLLVKLFYKILNWAGKQTMRAAWVAHHREQAKRYPRRTRLLPTKTQIKPKAESPTTELDDEA